MLLFFGRIVGWIGYLCNKYVCSVVAIAFPFHQSFKALGTEDRIDDDIQALSFWIIFGFWNCIEFYMEWLVRWIPFYYWVKTILLLWLIFPIKIFGADIGGSHVVYKVFIERYLSKYEPVIDEYLGKIGIKFPDKEEEDKKKKKKKTEEGEEVEESEEVGGNKEEGEETDDLDEHDNVDEKEVEGDGNEI